jgi:undecaprenyl-diphosphatase
MLIRVFRDWNELDDLELKIVRRFAALSRHNSVKRATRLVNVLGDGWAYLPIAAVIAALAYSRPWAWTMFVHALLAAALAHLVHALLKRKILRLRPFEHDPLLTPIARALDRYSFPSGHCMTMTCVALPIVDEAPVLWPVALATLITLAVCRLIAAHHYPSDVLAGIIIGIAVAWPVSKYTSFG